MTKKQKFKKAYAVELLRIAEGDLQSAEGLAVYKKGRPENTLFLAQQAIEKALKAVLCWNEVPLPLTHEIGILLELFPSTIVVPETESMVDLGQFATVRRYEEGVVQITTEEIKATIALALRTVEWAKSQID